MQIHAHNKKKQMKSTCFTPNPLLPASRESQHIQISWSVAIKWTQHINNTCTKSKKLLGLIYRHFYRFSTPTSLFQMYISLVHPNLEYAICQSSMEPIQSRRSQFFRTHSSLHYVCVLNLGTLAIKNYFSCSPYKISSNAGFTWICAQCLE